MTDLLAGIPYVPCPRGLTFEMKTELPPVEWRELEMSDASGDLITDLKVVNGGWRATLRDGSVIDVTDKEVTFAGCAQDAVLMKARDRNIDAVPATEYEDTGWQDHMYCGLHPTSWSDQFEALVDPGDLMQDPLPEGRAAAGRVMRFGDVLVGCSRITVTRAGTGQTLRDVVYADATKGYVIVLTQSAGYAYARIDGIAIKVDRI